MKSLNLALKKIQLQKQVQINLPQKKNIKPTYSLLGGELMVAP